MTGAPFARFARRVHTVAVLVLAFVALTWQPARAADLPWKQARKFERVVEQKDLRELLREFTGGYGISVVIDPQVTGTVTGRFTLTPQSTLDYLASTYGLVWFYDGNVLYISPADSVLSDVIALPAQSTQRTMRTLERLGLLDPRFPINFDEGSRVARVAGPRPYVELVRNTLRSIDSDASGADEAVVRVFRLRYAYAADQRVDASNDSTVPGLATVLGQLFPAQQRVSSKSPSSANGALTGRPKLVPVKGTTLTVPETPDVAGALEAFRPGSAASGTGNPLPQFRADQRVNAVIVRDLPSRIGQYEEIIRSLDTRPIVVEIEARIIEVSTDEFENLGIDWRLTSGRVDINAGRGPLPSLTRDGALAGQGSPLGDTIGALGVSLASGVVATTVLSDAGRSLILRINALAKQGKANVTSTPRVATLDNIEAVIEDAQQFYVRVQSERDAGLFQVNSGTSLRVRPLVVAEDGSRQFKLAIRIEDGAPTAQLVDAIPVVRRTSIGTWAFINEGQSLLIGGFTQLQNSEVNTRVPVLSSIPVIGNLFKSTEKKQLLVERLFMLTPRIVEM
jgi:type III secretion protein C